MPEALEPAVDLARHVPVRVERPVEDLAPRLPFLGEPEVLHRHQLGDGEAVVHLGHVELGPRVADPRLLVGLPRRDPGRLDVGAVPARVARFLAVRHGELHRLDGHELGLAEVAGDLRGGHDRARRAVAHPAAVEEADGLGDHGRLEDLLLRHLAPQVGLGVLRPVRVALDGDPGHRALEIVLVHPVRAPVAGRELGEHPGSGEVRPVHVVGDPAGALGEAAVAGVLELLAAEGEGHVARPRRHRVDRPPERLGAARAEVLDPGHRDVGKAQRNREGEPARADVDRLDRGGEPRGLDPVLLDAGVGETLGERFDHEVLRLHVPALAELRAPHPEDRDLVLDSTGHGGTSDA